MPDTDQAPHPTFCDDTNIRVVSYEWLSSRTVELRVASAALAHPVGVRIIVPAGYDPAGERRYPTLYLLHGGLGGFRDWTDQGGIEEMTEDLEVIIVTPHGGSGGWYRDWDNFGRGGTPKWETFHLEHLLGWVDSQLRTRSDAEHRAIGGVSMGGYGALSYAARHPDLFAAAVSFSGAVNTSIPLVQALVCVSSLSRRRPPFAINRLPVVGRDDWHDHNPWHLAEALRGMHLALYTGAGRPTRWPRDDRPKDLQEHQVHVMNLSLHRRLKELGIAHTWCDYGPATHTWDNWKRSMAEELPVIMAIIGSPA